MSRRALVGLGVIVVLGMVLGVLLGPRHLSKEITQTQIDRTFEIKMIEFNDFKKDVGRYPSSYAEMINADAIPGWKGPYFRMAVEKQLFKIKGDDFIFNNGIQFRYSQLQNGHELRSPGLDGRYYTADDTVEVLR